MLERPPRPDRAAASERREAARERRREQQRRHRQRLAEGRRVYPVELDGQIIDLLVRLVGWLTDAAAGDDQEVGRAGASVADRHGQESVSLRPRPPVVRAKRGL
jgi:hypothetical protein